MRRQALMDALGVLTLTCGSRPAPAAEFQPVVRWGCVSGGSFYKIQFGNTDLSADGRVIVSRAHSGNGWCEAFRWSAGTGQIEWLGHYNAIEPDEDHPSPWSMACATSTDGSVVVGSSLTGHSHPLGIGYEVQLISGFSWQNGTFTHLPRWMYTHHAYPLAVSADGSVIVGQSGEINDYWRPFVWINGEMYALQGLHSSACPPAWTPGGQNGRYISCNGVSGVSGDGSVAAGRLYDGANVVPVRWDTATQTPAPLPLLGGDTEGAAYDASHDGSMIVGRSGDRGVVWLESFGYTAMSLETLLRSVRLGDDISGWELPSVSMVSANGKDIAGLGISPEGEYWLWHADLRNPQPNDACAFAQWIGGGPVANTRVKTTLGSLRDATVDGASACEFAHGPDVWYSFSAPVGGYLYLQTCGSISQPNPVHQLDMSVHHGPCPGGGATTIWCTDNCAGPPCEGTLPCINPQHLPITAGENYLVRIARKADDTSVGEDFELKSQFLPNTDACDDAFIVDVPGPGEDPALTLGLTSRATLELTPVCDQVDQTAPGVWYKVMGTGRTIVADTLDWTDYDTKVSVFCGGCGGLLCVAANDDYHHPEVLGSTVSWCSKWGAVYHILVHGHGSETGNFALKLWDGGSCTPAPDACTPPNDTCEDAVHVAPGDPAEIIGDNTGATWDSTASCAASYDDVWYRYRAACEGTVLIDTCQPDIGSLQQTVLSVYDACGGTELDCDFDPTAPCLGRSSVVASTNAGRDYWIRVANRSADTALDGTFPLRIEELPDAMSLAGSALPDATQGEHYEAVIPIAGGCPPYEVQAELPRGLRFIRFAAIFGTPEVSGEFVIPVTVHDQSGRPAKQFTVTLRVLPSNDDCVQAIPVTEGGIAFGSIEATTDGPDEPFGCNFAGYTHVESDIWFCYTSSCEGRATASLCGSDYNTKLAAYNSCRCGAGLGGLLACDDDSCNLQSEVTFDVHEGWAYAIRVGGYEGAQGNGQLTVTCENKPACCLPDGSCQEQWPQDCTSLGGVVQETRVRCENVNCPAGPEACCLRDGTCEGLSPDVCRDRFGFPQGEGTTCATTMCSQPQACCFDDGSCADLPPEDCSACGGTPRGPETSCATVACTQPQQACCFDDGSCQDFAPDACSGQGGTSQGTGTTCATTTCPMPPDACCFADMSCQNLPPNECIAQDGMPQYGRLCEAFDCTELLGACCFEDGSCQDLVQGDCLAQGGIGYAPDAACATHSCSQPEACCFSDGSCDNFTAANCQRRRGESGGPGSACGEDCNGDLFDDACQVFGDVNLSGSVDLNDWQQMVNCLSGPGVPVSGQTCRPCILDCDDDVDLHDIAVFQRASGRY